MSAPDQTCEYCHGPLSASAEALRQNPYCAACLNKRLAVAADANPVVRWERRGKYVTPIRSSRPQEVQP